MVKVTIYSDVVDLLSTLYFILFILFLIRFIRSLNLKHLFSLDADVSNHFPLNLKFSSITILASLKIYFLMRAIFEPSIPTRICQLTPYNIIYNVYTLNPTQDLSHRP